MKKVKKNILNVWKVQTKEEKIKLAVYLILLPTLIAKINILMIFGYFQIIGVISYFKLKNGSNSLYLWLLFGLFLILNFTIITGILIVLLGALLAPFYY